MCKDSNFTGQPMYSQVFKILCKCMLKLANIELFLISLFKM